MVRTYIIYKGQHYSTNICTFYKDCVHVFDYDDMSGIEEFIAPNGTYEYVEEEIEVNKLDYQIYLDTEQAKRERVAQAIDLAKASFPYMRPENPYDEQLHNSHSYPGFRDFIYDGIWETQDNTDYPFFNRQVYMDYKKCFDDYNILYRNHLDFFLSKLEE